MDYQIYINEHKELYRKLEYFLQEFTKLKNKRDDGFLIRTSKEFYLYLEKLLLEHFLEEERDLFPNLSDVDKAMLERIINDHQEIKDKFVDLKRGLEEFESNPELFDYKIKILFPSYNLIATINHHAQREDKHIFKVELV